MPNIKIKQMDDRIATQGVHFGGDRRRRKLEPGEVVTVDEGEFFNSLWNTGKIELTMEPATRPLDYQNEDEARYCSPSFKPRDPSDERDSELARTAVAERMAQLATEAEAEKPKPAAKAEAAPPAKKAAKKKAATSSNRRAERRAAAKANQDGAANIAG